MLNRWHSYTMQALADRGEIPIPPDTEVWYAAAGQVALYTQTGVVSHTYEDGIGKIVFTAAVETLNNVLRGADIRKVFLPACVAGISSNAFRGCGQMLRCHMPDSVATIGNYAFLGCGTLVLSKLPASLASLGTSAFSANRALRAITFRSTPSTIGLSCFYNCTNLATIRVPWAEGAVSGAPWGAPATTQIIYNSTPQ